MPNPGDQGSVAKQVDNYIQRSDPKNRHKILDLIQQILGNHGQIQQTGDQIIKTNIKTKVQFQS